MPTEDHDATLYQFTPPPPEPGNGPGPEPGLPGAPGWSAPNGGRRRARRRSSRVTKAAAGLALILGTGTGAAVVLATSSGQASSLASTSASTPTTAPPGPRGGLRPPWHERFGALGLPGPGVGASFGLAGPGGVVHGSITVQGPNGTYETLDTQVGTVEAVSSNSITVKSADGYSQEYSVGPSTVVYADYDGIGSVNKGDNVAIMGLVGSAGVSAERVVDITQVQANGRAWEPPRPSTPGLNAGTGPSTTESSADDPGPVA